MRHRRRLNTQTIRRKSSTETFIPKQKSQSNNIGKFFTILTVVIILFSAGYFLYDKFPVLESFFNGLTDSSKTTEKTQEVPKLPAENDSPEEVQTFTPIQKRIQIEVLNGCGEAGIAKELSDKLKKLDYDIVNSGNYLENGKINFNVTNSKIIDQIKSSENIARAKKLAEILGIDANLIESYENPSPIADLTIVIGKDFKQLTINEKD